MSLIVSLLSKPGSQDCLEGKPCRLNGQQLVWLAGLLMLCAGYAYWTKQHAMLTARCADLATSPTQSADDQSWYASHCSITR
jgi:hypothetical protein